MRVVCLLLDNFQEKEKLAEACFRFTPQICLGERSIFLEIGSCRNLYSESSVKMRLLSLIKRFGIKSRITVADDIPTALALALYQGCTTKESLPIEALQIFANPFCNSQSLEKPILSLKQLGIRTLMDFKSIPRSSLASRFGKTGLLAAQFIETAAQMPWPRFYPAERILEVEQIDESYQIQDLQPVLFILKKQIDKSLLRLRGAGRLASEVEVRMRLETLTTVPKNLYRWKLDLAFPQGSVIGLLPIIQEKIERSLQTEPLPAAICALEFEILKHVPGGYRQKDFFSKKEEDEEAFRAIVSKLTEKLGSNKAFFAAPVESYMPEKSWKKSLQEPQDLPMNLPDRPSRVLRSPMQIFKTDNYFQSKGHRWIIMQMAGPERLSGEWWFQENERDYYRVTVDTGEELWVYALPHTQEYYLHGIFD